MVISVFLYGCVTWTVLDKTGKKAWENSASSPGNTKPLCTKQGQKSNRNHFSALLSVWRWHGLATSPGITASAGRSCKILLNADAIEDGDARLVIHHQKSRRTWKYRKQINLEDAVCFFCPTSPRRMKQAGHCCCCCWWWWWWWHEEIPLLFYLFYCSISFCIS